MIEVKPATSEMAFSLMQIAQLMRERQRLACAAIDAQYGDVENDQAFAQADAAANEALERGAAFLQVGAAQTVDGW